MSWIHVFSATLTAVLAAFAAGHGQRAITESGVVSLDGGVAATAGIGAAVVAWFSGLINLIIGKLNPPTPTPGPGPGPNPSPDNSLPQEILDIISAGWGLLQHKGDPVYIKALVMACMKAAYSMLVLKFGDTPELRTLFQTVLNWVAAKFVTVTSSSEKMFGTRPVEPVFVQATVAGVPTLAELVIPEGR